MEAIRLRRAGLTVAVVPGEWALAAAGVDVVIGARAAAWAPCPGLAAAVVLDEHDESLQEERSPTWHARDVVVERARRAGAPVLLVSPCPSVNGLAAVGDRLVRPPIEEERAGWPIVEVVDRSRDEPWKTSLVTSALIRHLRDHERTVVCVHNTPGRSRILACRSCRALVRCARCDAAVGMADDGTLACRRCGETRPAVCLVCGASAFANLRPGVTRLREELEAAAGRPVVAVTGRDEGPPPAAGVYVGTEAVLHRVDGCRRRRLPRHRHRAAGAALPRRRAGDGAAGSWRPTRRAHGDTAAGCCCRRSCPRHEVVQAALLADPGRIVEPERARRQLLGLPPFGALAAVSGSGADDVAAALRDRTGDHRRRRARLVDRPRRHVGRPRPRTRRRPAPQGLPRPDRGRPSTPLNVEEAVALGGRQAGRRPALLGEPAVQRVGAEVLLHDEDGAALGRQAVEPPSEQVVQRRPCRCGSAGSTRSRRSARRRGRRRARRRSRCRRHWRRRSPRTAHAPAR